MADGQLPAQQLELVRQPEHVGMHVEHRVARLDGHAFDTSQPAQRLLQGLRLPLLDQGQEREAVLKAPVERAQPGSRSAPGQGPHRHPRRGGSNTAPQPPARAGRAWA